MPIDDCSHTFAELAQNVLPSLMAQMQQAIASPTPVSDFLVPRQGVKTVLCAHRRAVDFPGCYVLIERGKTIVCRHLKKGVSPSVVSRARHEAFHRHSRVLYRRARFRFGSSAWRMADAK